MQTSAISFGLKIKISILFIVVLLGCCTAQAQAPFITTWQTDQMGLSDDHSIMVPLADSSFYEFTVDWGDGLSDAYEGMGYALEVVHVYVTQGTYSVQISGDFPRIRFTNAGDQQKILSVDQWGDISWQSFEQAFQFCSNLHVWATDVPDLTNVVSLNGMFRNASSMNESLNDWDVSGVTTISTMFSSASSFNQPLETWNVSNVTDMSSLFQGATAFSQPLNSWQVSNVTNMYSLFRNALSYNQPLDTWDVSNVNSMSHMFLGAQVFNQPLNSWQVYNVTKMDAMFEEALSFNQPLDNWDVSGVTHVAGMTQMFAGAASFNQPLNSWDVSSVSRMWNMFRNATSFNQPLDNWDVSNVENMERMFEGATAFDRSLGSWEISSVQSMTGMLDESGMSHCNYDSTLLGWAAGVEIPYYIQLSATGVHYTEAGAPGRQQLVDNYSWSISGDELVNIPDFTVMYEMSDPQITIIPTGGSGNYTFNWSGPDNFSSADSSIIAPVNGQYYVVVSDGCYQWSQSFDIMTVDISNYTTTQFQPYPNPSSGMFRLNTQNINVRWVRVFDMSGRMVHESGFYDTTGEIDLRNLDSGTYICSAVNNMGISVGEARIAIVR